MPVKCPKCGKVIDYSYYNKCECGCEFTVLASEKGIDVKEVSDASKET